VRPQNTTVNPFDLFAREEVLRCVAVSDPSTPPEITWYRLLTQVNASGSGRLAAVSDRLAADSDGSLIFRGVAETEWIDFIGWYRCVADNGYTSDSAELYLDVLTSPPVPTRRECPSFFSKGVISRAWLCLDTNNNNNIYLPVKAGCQKSTSSTVIRQLVTEFIKYPNKLCYLRINVNNVFLPV